jgi:hypothetical protein
MFAARFGWCRAFSIKAKWEVHEVLSTRFAQDQAPNVMVMYGARELTLGNFMKKCGEASCHIKQTEPHSPCG